MPASGRAAWGPIAGYCLYDVANSSFTTLISTVAFAVYFSQVVVGAGDGRSDLLWSATTAGGHLVLILSAPLLGAVADRAGRRKRFLLLSTVLTVVSCALLSTVGPGQIGRGVLLFLVASVGFEGGYIFYNALLREVSTPATLGRISGLSWGVGFLGGLAALALCAPLLTPLLDAAGRPVASAVAGYRLSFLVVALFFALVSVPTFLLVPEPAAPPARGSWREHGAVGLSRIAATLSQLRRHRDAALLAAASACYYGGIETVIKFSAIYATVTFGMQGPELTRLFILANVVAAPGTLAGGALADRIGHRRALAGTLLLWFGLLALGASAGSPRALWLLTPGIAIATGSTQAIGRALFSRLAPAAREAEFFGFYLLCNKAGSIGGLVLFGAISWLSGNQRHALLAVAPLFLAALVLVLAIRRGPPPEPA